MIFERVWHQFRSDWTTFVWVGLGIILGGIAVAVVFGGLFFLVAGASFAKAISALGPMAKQGNPDPFTIMFTLLRSLGPVFLLGFVVSALAGAYLSGGMVAALVAYRRGERPGIRSVLVGGIPYFGRFVVLTFIYGLISLLLLGLALVLQRVPFLGQLAIQWLSYVILVNLGIYAGYLIVNDGMGVLDALGTCFRAMGRKFGEAALSGLLLLGLAFGGAIALLVVMIPLFILAFFTKGLAMLIGVPLFMLLAGTLYFFLLYYFSERFETNVRPLVHPPQA